MNKSKFLNKSNKIKELEKDFKFDNNLNYSPFYEKKIKKLQNNFDDINNNNIILNEKTNCLLIQIDDLKDQLKIKDNEISQLNKKIKKLTKQNPKSTKIIQTDWINYNIQSYITDLYKISEKYNSLKQKSKILKIEKPMISPDLDISVNQSPSNSKNLSMLTPKSTNTKNLNSSNYIPYGIKETRNRINSINKLLDNQKISMSNSEYFKKFKIAKFSNKNKIKQVDKIQIFKNKNYDLFNFNKYKIY